MVTSVWPKHEILPVDEFPLLQLARLRPFGSNYLQGAISPELGLLAHPDGSRVLLLLLALIPAPDDTSSCSSLSHPLLGSCVAVIDAPYAKDNDAKKGKQGISSPPSVNPVRGLVWTCRRSSTRESTKGDSSGAVATVVGNAGLQDDNSRAVSCYLAVSWGSEVRLWQVTRLAIKGTYQTVEVLTDWNMTEVIGDAATCCSGGGGSGKRNGAHRESERRGSVASTGTESGALQQGGISNIKFENADLAEFQSGLVAGASKQCSDGLDQGIRAAAAAAVYGGGSRDDAGVRAGNHTKSEIRNVQCLSFRPNVGHAAERESFDDENEAVPLAAWHSGGATLFGTNHGSAINRATFPTPVTQKRTSGSWSGCGNYLAVSSGGEIRVYRPWPTGLAAVKTGCGAVNSKAQARNGGLVRDGWIAPSADEHSIVVPTDIRAVHENERLGKRTDRPSARAVVDSSRHRCGVPSTSHTDMNVTAQDGEGGGSTSPCVSGTEFRTVLCVEALMKAVSGGASGSSSPMSSPSPRRSPSPELSPSRMRRSLAPLRKAESLNAKSMSVAEDHDRLLSSLQVEEETPAVFGLCSRKKGGGGGGGGLSLRSRSSSSRSRSSPAIGDMRAMCPGGPNAFFGTTDGCLGLGSLLGGLGLPYSPAVDTQSRRCLNDSFFGSSNARGGHGGGGTLAGDTLLASGVVDNSNKRAEAEEEPAAALGMETSAVSRTDSVTGYISGGLQLPEPPPPPLTARRRGGFRNVLPGQNWQAGVLRPTRSKGKDPTAETPRRTKSQPRSSAFLSDPGVTAAAKVSALSLGEAGAVAHGSSSSSSNDNRSNSNIILADASDSSSTTTTTTTTTFVDAGSSSRLSRTPWSLRDALTTTTNTNGASVSSKPRGSSLPPQRSPRKHSTESTVIHVSPPSGSPPSSEVLDLRGKLGDGSIAVHAVHPLLRLPLGGEGEGGGGAAITNVSCRSLAPVGGDTGPGVMDEKEHGSVGNGTGRGPLGDRKDSSRQPCLVLVTTGFPDSGQKVPGTGESGRGAVDVKAVATLPPALSSPDLVAASEDGTLVCVGSHACELVACYRVGLPSADTSTVIAPPSVWYSASCPSMAHRATGNPVATSAGRSDTTLLEKDGKNDKKISDHAASSESPSSRTTGHGGVAGDGGDEGGTAGAFGLHGGANAEASSVTTGNRRSKTRSRKRRVCPARAICTLRLPQGLRAKGLVFANVGPQPQEELRRRRQRRGHEETTDSTAAAAAANLTAGEKGESPESAGNKSSGGEGLLSRRGIMVLVLAAAPVAAPFATLSRGARSSFGSSMRADRASSSARASGGSVGSGGSGGSGGGGSGSSSHVSSYRTVLLRYLLPAMAVDDAQGAGVIPPQDFSSGFLSLKGDEPLPPSEDAAGASWALRHAARTEGSTSARKHSIQTFGQHGHTCQGRGDPAAKLPADQMPLTQHGNHIADFHSKRDPDTGASLRDTSHKNKHDSDEGKDSAIHGTTAVAHSTRDQFYRVPLAPHNNNPGAENSGENSGGSGGAGHTGEGNPREQADASAGSSGGLGVAEVTTIIRALDRLEGRFSSRLDRIEKMLWDVGERVGSLERVVTGSSMVVAELVDSGDN